MLSHGPLKTGFDFDSPGKRAGFIDMAHSDNEHAFCAIRLPVGLISSGAGPVVLLTAGNHGDEYEGQVILNRLMQALHPQDVHGTLILLPALNQPAVRARQRVSPLDQGNMNRSFAQGGRGPTAAIAAFVGAHLIPRADCILDFHSGGTATRYVNCSFLCLGPDAALNSANLALAEAFGAPFTMVTPIDGTGGDFDTAAHLQQTPFLSCELGGLGRFSPSAFRIGHAGTLRVLRHMGVLAGDATAPATAFIDIAASGGHATATHHGLAELHVSLGDHVEKDDPVADLFDMHNFGAPPVRICAGTGGVVSVVRRNPVVEPGDHLCLVSPIMPRPETTGA